MTLSRFVPMSICLVALTAACSGGTDSPSDKSTDTDTDTTSDYPEAVVFQVVSSAGPVACGVDLPGLGSTDATARLRDLRLYVSDLVLSGPSGEGPVVPDQDGQWQYTDVTLLDFEDGSAECAETGNADLNDRVTGFIPEGDWDTLTFTIGLPFDLNHLAPESTQPPLDVPSMFWAWQTGHKYVRIDVKNDQTAPNDGWNFHLGASGCTSTSSLTPPDAECARPNLARISVPYDPFAGDVVILDLEALYAGADIRTNLAGTPSGCMSSPDDTGECAPLFTALGMSFGTGACVDDCDGQVAFRSE